MLLITVNNDRKITLNGESMGSLDNLSKLKKFIKEKMTETENNAVFKPETNDVIREVIIVPKYKDENIQLNNLIQSLEKVGANPILIDWNNYTENIAGGGGHGFGSKKNCNFFDKQ